MKFITGLLFLLTPVTLALPTSALVDEALDARACYAQCGSACYTSSQVNAALNAGYNYYKQGTTAGGSTYPHTYNNYEGFNFPVSGPYQEFPLKSSVYTGGSPGADRVIFNTGGKLAGEITHTGASGNNFVACT